MSAMTLGGIPVYVSEHLPRTKREQVRFPRSKKKRIRKKWSKDERNWRVRDARGDVYLMDWGKFEYFNPHALDNTQALVIHPDGVRMLKAKIESES